MSKKYLKVLSVATIAAMMTTMAAPVFAANGDFYDNLNNTPYNAMDYRTSAPTFNALLAALETRPSDFVFENGGLGYNYDKMLTAITAGTTAGQTVVEAFLAAKADPANAEALPVVVATVSSVSAINSTITVTLSNTLSANPSVSDFAVTQAIDGGGALNVTPSVTSLDTTGKIVTLTVPAVVATTADQSVVNSVSYKGGVAVAAPAFTVSADVTAPTIQSITSVNGNQVVVVFDEKVGQTNAEDESNYKLQNTVTGASLLLNTNTAIAVLGADGKTLTITLSDADINTAGIGINGLKTLDAVNYRLFLNPGSAASTNVFDLLGNRLGVNSFKQFTGVIASDENAPALQTATLSTGTKQLTVTFNEKAYSVDATKVSLTDGTNTVTFASEDTANVTTSGAAATTIIYTVNNAANITTLSQLTGTITTNFTAGAVKDVAGNAITTASLVTTATINPTVVATGTNYDELANKLSIKFNKVMKASSLTSMGNISFTNSADGGLNSGTITGGMTLDTIVDSDTFVFSLNAAAAAEMESNRVTDFDKYSIALVAGTVTDVAGTNLGVTNTVVMAYTKDILVPTLQTATYNTNTNTLVLAFSEAMNGDATHPADTKLALKKLNATSDAFVQIVDADLDDIDGVDGAIIVNTTDLSAGKAKWNTAKTELSVMLTSNEAGFFEGYDGATGRYVVFGNAHALADSNTNALADTIVANKVSITYSDDTAPTLSIATAALSPSLINVVFDKAMDDTSLTSATYTIVNEANANITGTVKSVEVATDKLSALLTLNSALPTGNYQVTVTGAKDSLGNAISTTSNVKTGMTVAADTTAPTMSSVAYADTDGSHNQSAGDKITVKFSEPIAIANGAVLTDIFNLDVNGSGIVDANTDGKEDTDTFGVGATVAAGLTSDSVVITLGTSSSPITFATTAIRIVDSNGATGGTTNTSISDLAATPNYPDITAGANTKVIATPTSDAAPILQTAVLADFNGNATIDAGDTITLTFDKTLVTQTDWAGANEAADKLVFTDTAASDGAVVMVASNIVTNGTTVTYTVATSSVNSLQAGIKVNVAAANANVVDSWGQNATQAIVAVTTADAAAAKIIGAQFFDGSANAIAGTGDAVVLTFDKAILAGTVAPTTFTGLGTPGTATYGLVKNISPTKVLVTLNNATGFATTNTLNMNALLPNNDLRTIAGTSAVASASPVAITVSNVEAGTTAVKLNGVTVTATTTSPATNDGIVAADADALNVGSFIRAYQTTDGSELTQGALEKLVVDTTVPADGSDAVSITDTNFAAAAGNTSAVYITKDGVVHVVNFTGDMQAN